MRLSDHLNQRTAEEVRRDILMQIKAESERSGVAMNNEWASDKAAASDKAEQGRAITRGEEARVADALRAVLNGGGYHLQWEGDRLKAIHCFHWSATSVEQMAARAGIVPGPEGWCWAPLADAPYNGPDDDTTARMLGVDIERVRLARERGSKDDQALLARAGFTPGLYGWQWSSAAPAPPPAWLTAAVLAALPADGTPRSLAALLALGMGAHGWTANAAEIETACAALVASGEIEMGPDSEGRAWRRWGVPEGAEWGEPVNGIALLVGLGTNVVGRAEETGEWWAYPGDGERAFAWGTASPPTLAAARQAALRACYERGVFTPSPAPSPKPALSTPPPARLRAALLAALQRGPVLTTAALLPALDTAMGERAGVAVATGAEAMRAAREIGARVDGVEWSLPAVPDGWGWRRVIASRWYLAPLDASDPERERVAELSVDDGISGIGGLMWHVRGGLTWQGCASVEEGQAAALKAARLAGLFAAPRASTVAADDTAPKGPPVVLTAQNGEGVTKGPAPAPSACQCSACRLPAIEHALALATAEIDRQRGRADAADPLHGAALAVSAERQRLRAAAPGTDEWSAAEIEVALTTGALLDVLGVEVDGAAADARHAQRIAENERDEARAAAEGERQRVQGIIARAERAEAAHRDQSHKAADAERSLGFARRDLEVARGALGRVEGERDTALHNYSSECALSESLRSQLDAVEMERSADFATLDAVQRLRTALGTLCAGPGPWTWPVGEEPADAAARLIGVMSSRIADFETVQRVADTHRQEMRAARDAALSELATLKADLAALHALWATGSRGAT